MVQSFLSSISACLKGNVLSLFQMSFLSTLSLRACFTISKISEKKNLENEWKFPRGRRNNNALYFSPFQKYLRQQAIWRIDDSKTRGRRKNNVLPMQKYQPPYKKSLNRSTNKGDSEDGEIRTSSCDAIFGGHREGKYSLYLREKCTLPLSLHYSPPHPYDVFCTVLEYDGSFPLLIPPFLSLFLLPLYWNDSVALTEWDKERTQIILKTAFSTVYFFSCVQPFVQ